MVLIDGSYYQLINDIYELVVTAWNWQYQLRVSTNHTLIEIFHILKFRISCILFSRFTLHIIFWSGFRNKITDTVDLAYIYRHVNKQTTVAYLCSSCLVNPGMVCNHYQHTIVYTKGWVENCYLHLSIKCR